MKRTPMIRTRFDRKPDHAVLRRRRALLVSRPRKGSRRALKATLDKVFSLYIRLRDGRCVTCPSTKDLECSHFYGRSDPALRYDPINCNAQCHSCNQLHNRNREPYEKAMRRIYSAAGMAELNRRRREHRKLEDSDYQALIVRYEMLTQVLKEAA